MLNPGQKSGSYYIGIDGGGTRTRVSVIDELKNVLVTEIDSSSNWNSVGIDNAKETIFRVVHRAINNSGISKDNVKGICIGMAGVDRPADKSIVSSWLEELLPNTNHIIVNDGVIALVSGTGGVKHGIVVISGTGSISLGFNSRGDGEQKRSAGWGPLLGDTGGGYVIGNNVLVAVCRAHDGRGIQTSLTSKVLQHLKLQDPTEIIKWKYSDLSWDRTAALSQLLFESAKEGDEVAKRILDETAEGLLEAILAVQQKLGFEENEEIPIVFAGGNLTHDDSILRTALQDKLTRALPNTNILLPSIEPCTAAAILSLNSDNKK